MNFRRIFALCALMSICWLSRAATVSGVLKVNGNTYKITDAYLLAVEDPAKNIEETLLIFSDRPLSEELLNENPSVFDLRDAGMNGLQITFSSGGNNYSMLLVGAGLDASISSSGTFDRSRLTAYQANRVAGRISDEKQFTDTKLSYQIAFDANPVPRKPKAAPSATEITAARNSTSAKAYMAHQQALRDGDLAKIAATVVPERAAQMKDPQFKAMLGMIQAMMPADIGVVKAVETGDNATLSLTGTEDGKPKSGTATLKKINGKWLVERESWK